MPTTVHTLEPDVVGAHSAADFRVFNHGSVVQFFPLTESAYAWLDEHVHIEAWQWVGRHSFAVDWRFSEPLRNGIEDAGLTIE